MPAPKQITLTAGSKEWHELRKKCTVPIPGKFSALYFLASEVVGLRNLVPMTMSAHYALCLFAEGATGIPEIDSARVRLIQVARGFGKSGIVTGCLILQQLLQNRDWSAGLGNESQRMADKFLAMIKAQFESNDLLRHLFPEVVPSNFRETTWKESEIIVNRTRPRPTSPSVLAVGVGGTVTGVHVDHWIVDDLISQDAAENALRGSWTEIEAANRWVTRLSALLCSPERDPITFIGTPWFEGDTYEFIEKYFGNTEDLNKPKDFECIWTLRLPDGTTQSIPLYRRGDIVVFRRPAIENGRSIFPERWTLEELEKMSMRPESAAFFQANYMLKPSGGRASIFDLEWLKYYSLDGKQLVYKDQTGRTNYVNTRDLTIYISLDPAFSERNTAARTAIPVVGTNGTEIFLLEDFATRGIGVDEMANELVNFCMRYPVQRIFIETITAQIAVADAVRRVARERGVSLPSIEEIRSHGPKSKDLRIYALEPYFKKGLFYIHPSHTNFKDEYSTFPRAALRDLLDALSFQKDWWERATKSLGAAQSSSQAVEQAALARLRANARLTR